MTDLFQEKVSKNIIISWNLNPTCSYFDADATIGFIEEHWNLEHNIFPN